MPEVMVIDGRIRIPGNASFDPTIDFESGFRWFWRSFDHLFYFLTIRRRDWRRRYNLAQCLSTCACHAYQQAEGSDGLDQLLLGVEKNNSRRLTGDSGFIDSH